MIGNHKIRTHQRWRQIWSRPLLKGTHQSAAFSWNFVKHVKARSERFLAWLQNRDYPHYGPKAKIPELFHRRDLNFFALRSGRLHFDKALRPKDCYDLLDAAAAVGALEVRLGYKFKDRMLCLQALKSTDSAVPLYWKGTMFELVKNNRLALLGDRVLSFVLCTIWYKTGHSTKSYSIMSAATLSRAALAVTASTIRLQEALLCLPGFADRNSNHLAEGFEAVIGAVYVDSNEDLAAVKQVLQNLGLDQHRNLKAWEQMTEEERIRTVAERGEAGKRQDPKGGEPGTDYVSEKARGFIRPLAHASMPNVGETQQLARTTVDGLSKPKVNDTRLSPQIAQAISVAPDPKQIHRLVDGLPLVQRRTARHQLREVVQAAKKGKPLIEKAANLALIRYTGLLKTGNKKAGGALASMFQDALSELRMEDDLREKYLPPQDVRVLASTVEEKQSEGQERRGEDEGRDLKLVDEDPEKRKDQEEDKAWNVAVQDEDRAPQSAERLLMHKPEQDKDVKIGETKTSGPDEEKEKMPIPGLRGKVITDTRVLEESVAIEDEEKFGGDETGNQKISQDRGQDDARVAAEETSTCKVREGDKTHKMQGERNGGTAGTGRLKREEEDEEVKMMMIWLEKNQKLLKNQKMLTKLGGRKFAIVRKKNRYQKRIAEIRKARAQDNISSEEARDSEKLIAIEEDTKARIAEEVSVCQYKSEGTTLRSEEEQESSQTPGYTAEEQKKKVRSWRALFSYGFDTSRCDIETAKVELKVLKLTHVTFGWTIELITMAEARRPQGWPTLDRLQKQAAAAITSPHYTVHPQDPHWGSGIANRHRNSIAQASLQGWRLGSVEWRQSVEAFFHRATKMELLLVTMEREGHLTHWKEERPDRSQVLFVQAWDSAKNAGTSTGEFLRRYDESKANTAGVHPTTELVLRAYAALERKLMDQIAPSNAETTPWEEAVREAVQEQDEKRRREVEEKQTAAAEEAIVHMMEAEQARMAEAAQKAKTEELRIAKVAQAEIRKVQSQDLYLVRGHMQDWRRKLKMHTWHLSLEEHQAHQLGDTAIRQLPAISQINIQLYKIQDNVISHTLQITESPGTRRWGPWAQSPPAIFSQLLEQTQTYCRTVKSVEDWLHFMSAKHRQIILYTIERGFRIGSQEWNEAFEAYFHRSVQISMASSYTRFVTSPELQIAAVEYERQFDEEAASIRGKRSSTQGFQAAIRRSKRHAFSATFPSKRYRTSEIRATIRPNSVLTGQLWMTEPGKPGRIVASMPTCSARLPSDASAWLEAVLGVEGSDWESSVVASDTDTLPTTGTLALVNRAEEAAIPETENTKTEQQEAGNQEVENHGVENHEVEDHKAEVQQSEDSSAMVKGPVIGIPGPDDKDSSNDTSTNSNSPPKSPPASDSVSQSAEPNTTSASAGSTFRTWREAQAEAQPSGEEAPESSKTASKKEAARKRAATSISKNSWRINRLTTYKPPSRGTNHTSRSFTTPKPASIKAEASEKVAFSMSECSSTGEYRSRASRSIFRNINETGHAPLPSAPVPGDVEQSPRRPFKPSSTSRMRRTGRAAYQSSDTQAPSPSGPVSGDTKPSPRPPRANPTSRMRRTSKAIDQSSDTQAPSPSTSSRPLPKSFAKISSKISPEVSSTGSPSRSPSKAPFPSTDTRQRVAGLTRTLRIWHVDNAQEVDDPLVRRQVSRAEPFIGHGKF